MTYISPAKPQTPAKNKKRESPHFSTAQTFVTIIADGQKFTVHKDLITFHSPYFDRAFNGNFIEGQTQTMTLSDVSASLFGVFVHWLYTKTLRHPGGPLSGLKVTEFAELWILGGMWLMPKFQNVIIDAFPPFLHFTAANKDDVISTLKLAYQDTSEETKLQKFLLQKVVALAMKLDIEDWLEGFPEKMLMDFTKALLKHHSRAQDQVLNSMLPKSSFHMRIEDI